MRMFRKSDEGFTLVELMVVVLIIGILVAIAIPVFNAASKSARKRTCDSNQRTIEGAVQQWLASDPTFVWPVGSTLINGDDALSNQGAYLKSPPKCPAPPAVAGRVNYYSVNTSGTIQSDNGSNTLNGWINDGGTVHMHY